MKRIFFVGFGIWLLATIALRLGGQLLFDTDTTSMKVVLLVVSAPLMFALPRRLFKVFSIASADRALGGIVLVAPGMFLDTISAMWFSSVFPNIRPDAAGPFGGWLLFCNVVALVSAATDRGRVKSEG